MNLHQAAHGDREFGFINTRMRKNRKVIVGHWRDPGALPELAIWMRVGAAGDGSHGGRIGPVGGQKRGVGVKGGKKGSAQRGVGV